MNTKSHAEFLQKKRLRYASKKICTKNNSLQHIFPTVFLIFFFRYVFSNKLCKLETNAKTQTSTLGNIEIIRDYLGQWFPTGVRGTLG
jgi:hypothetical protein